MGNVGDIQKALKAHDFKLVSSNKHHVYANPQGRTISVHLGSKLTDMMYRTILKDICRGSIQAGKVAKAQRPPVWTKEGPKVHVLHRGNVEIGCVYQVLIGDVWLWVCNSADKRDTTINPMVETLAEAKEILEGL